MSRLPPLPQLDWQDGVPFSLDRDDVYFSGDGLAEKRAVFLSGCGLPEAWAGRERFTVGELGFGTGLNLLALMDLWRRHRPSPAAGLDVLSFEGFLISAPDAERIHAQWPELADLSLDVLARWPRRAKGAQRIYFPDGVALTLFIDDISASLSQARARVDAWFLDGFAPSKNPEMWSAETMQLIARLSASGARAASYSVASDVRRNLEAAGFVVEKKKGFGRKKERLEATLRVDADPPPPCGQGAGGGGPQDGKLSRSTTMRGAAAPRPAPSPQGGGGARRRTILIIGAGIAGACAARAFLERNCSVTVLDKAAAPGGGASGNPVALVMPRLDAADSPASRALVEAYLYAQRFYAALGREAATGLDAVHRPRGEKERQRFAKLLADPPLDEALLQPLDPNDPSAGLRYLGAVAVRPPTALPALLDGATLRFGAHVTAIRENEVQLSTGETLPADLIIACAGMGLADIEGLAAPPLTGRLGQIEIARSSAGPNAIADGGYAVVAFDHLVFGATFEPADGEPQLTEAARVENLETLARLHPGLKPPQLSSRAAIRATTPDRFPFAGLPPNQNEKAPDADPAPCSSLRLIGGLGARGFLWAPLLAELLASEAFGEPSPVETSVAETLDPGRFLRRAQRRGS